MNSKRQVDLVLLGVQGSGKGTQGRILQTLFKDTVFLEMGSFLRHLVRDDSLGHGDHIISSISTFIKEGNLIPDDHVNDIIDNFISRHQDHTIIFDGICRTTAQKDAFDRIESKYGREYVGIYLKLDEHEARKRLLGRRICPVCKTTYPVTYKSDNCSYVDPEGKQCHGVLTKRNDDKEEGAVERRLGNFYSKTVAAIAAIKEGGTLIEVDAGLPVDDIAKIIKDQLIAKNYV